MDELAKLNAPARSGAVVDVLHGVPVADPYRALETDGEATTAWVNAQTAITERYLQAHERPGTEGRLSQLLRIGTLGGAEVAGEYVFYLKREGDAEQPALYVVKGTLRRDRPLVDPNTLGERVALDWFYPSPRGRYVAYGTSQNGDEKSTLRVIEVETGRILSEQIAHTKWARVSWLTAEDGFYYTRYPKEGEANWDPEHVDGYFPRIFFHRLGSDPDADPMVFSGTEPTDFPQPSVSTDDRWLVVNHFRGWSKSDVHLLDRRARGAAAKMAPIVVGRDSLTSAWVHGGRLWMLTNDGAPKYEIRAAPVARAGDEAARRVIVAQGDAAIEGVTMAGDRLVLHYVENVRSRIRVLEADGRVVRDVELPALGAVDNVSGQPGRRSTRVAMTFSSFFWAPSLLAFDVATDAAPTRLDQVRTDVDPNAFELHQDAARSRDGTPINVYWMSKRGLARDGRLPVLLTGYGGFNVNLLPSFSRHALYWLERGGVYAVANLRGGAEFGEEWHRAGMFEKKTNVFDDMEAVIRWLSSSGISSPDRIAITGGSNGGLLMGAMITRCPDAFRATVAHVGLYDMVRYHRFPPAELWTTEYGDPERPDALRWLHGYSPYHNVRERTAYPAILITTADHDSRVHWAHSTKFAAALQEATSSDRPIYFHMERQVGHGAGTRITDVIRRYVRQYTFVEHELGME
jgi:prolyl oligopeptidase